MKKILTLTLLLWAVALSVVAQSRSQSQRSNRGVTVTGKLVEADTKGPAMEATVQLLALPDSTYVTGVASDGQGNFRLPRVKAGKYLLKVSYIGFKTLYKSLQLNTSRPAMNIGTLTLESDAIMLAEAVIVAEAPQVQVVEDTIQFNSSAYRTPQGATLEELVKKLPGAEIDDDGNVKINGKDVSKIMLNGKEFFGGDVATALKNLPVEMIDKLKTYDKKSDLARITGIDDGEEETVLDLTVKKEMETGWFGNADVAGGTEDRYSARGMVNYFRGSTQLSIIGSVNNVNDQGFSGGGGGPRFRRNNGLTDKKWVGMNFATENDKIDMDGSVRYNYTKNNITSIGSTEDFLTNGNSFSNSNSQSRNISKNFTKYTPGANWNGSYYMNASTQETYRNFVLVYQDTYIMGDPGYYMGNTDVEIPEWCFTEKGASV